MKVSNHTEQLKIPLALKKFESGLVCIQSSQYSEQTLIDSIFDLIQQEKIPIT